MPGVGRISPRAARWSNYWKTWVCLICGSLRAFIYLSMLVWRLVHIIFNFSYWYPKEEGLWPRRWAVNWIAKVFQICRVECRSQCEGVLFWVDCQKVQKNNLIAKFFKFYLEFFTFLSKNLKWWTIPFRLKAFLSKQEKLRLLRKIKRYFIHILRGIFLSPNVFIMAMSGIGILYWEKSWMG